VTAGSFALVAIRLGAVPSLAAFCALFGGLVAVSVADLRTRLVPRRLLYPAAALVTAGLAAASADSGSWRPFLDGVIGGAVAFGVFCAIWWIYPKGLGFGDVRLAGLCGLALGFLGFRQLYIGFVAAFLFGAIGGVVALARRGSRRFPFAPALAAGTAFGVLWGGWLGNLWLHPG
jgi:leader peptidase (prepilin peptidase) / N-methyltransferase